MSNQIINMEHLNELFVADGQFCYLNSVSLFADVAEHIVCATETDPIAKWDRTLDALDLLNILRGMQQLDADVTFNRYKLSVDAPRVRELGKEFDYTVNLEYSCNGKRL